MFRVPWACCFPANSLLFHLTYLELGTLLCTDLSTSPAPLPSRGSVLPEAPVLLKTMLLKTVVARVVPLHMAVLMPVTYESRQGLFFVTNPRDPEPRRPRNISSKCPPWAFICQQCCGASTARPLEHTSARRGTLIGRCKQVDFCDSLRTFTVQAPT